MVNSLSRFVEKYQLALETARSDNPNGGLCGFETEWNLLDSDLRPLMNVGSGPNRKSFVEYLRKDCLAPWASQHTSMEVFHWMIEWISRPYYSPRAAVYEVRLMEAVLLNALSRAGDTFGEQLYTWHGNLLYPTQVTHASIPAGWSLAKRRYLERCVDLFGSGLATTGTHSNLSLPDPLFAWDFMHLTPTERGDKHLESYKSQFYITATRLMRAFAALFIATSASTPLRAEVQGDDEPILYLTSVDSLRNLSFPNPPEIDLPDLYRSYEDYLRISYDLVRRGIRFGNNNWTPVRARSFAEPVGRLIELTSENLDEIYSRGLYAFGEETGDNGSSVAEMVHQVEVQNLLARIDLPMARVEVRTDDGGHPLDLEIANMTLKHLLVLNFYADPEFARSFRYDREDIARARRNEQIASRDGLRAEIENPLTAKPIKLRDFLGWTLEKLRPLAVAVGLWDDLIPLREMSAGGPNTSERLRKRLKEEVGDVDQVPLEVLKILVNDRVEQVIQDVTTIVDSYRSLEVDHRQLGELFQRARDEAHFDPQAPVRFRSKALLEISYADKTSEIVDLARALIRIPSVTASPNERLEEVRRAATYIYDYGRDHKLEVRYFDQDKYPALLLGFPESLMAPVMFSGHFDVVEPVPDESQFDPRLEGDYLWGRGAGDMKTVVATYLVWFKDRFKLGPPYPPVNLMLIGNEEPGETEPMGTPHLLKLLAAEYKDHNGISYAPQLFIAGERTGERGDEIWGKVCLQNRGVMRFEVLVSGQRGHTGTAGRPPSDLVSALISVSAGIGEILMRHLTLESNDGWQSATSYPFIQVGTPGIYNISAGEGSLGVEVRPIPQDNLAELIEELRAFCESGGYDLDISVKEDGVSCPEDNPYLGVLLETLEDLSGYKPQIGRKLPATSARFAPGGQGIVWGQSGIAPHARDERHYLPSIEPYYSALFAFGEKLKSMKNY